MSPGKAIALLTRRKTWLEKQVGWQILPEDVLQFRRAEVAALGTALEALRGVRGTPGCCPDCRRAWEGRQKSPATSPTPDMSVGTEDPGAGHPTGPEALEKGELLEAEG